MSKKRRKDITKYGPTFFYMGIDPTIRKDRGWTQKELAYMTGGEISVRTIQNYENGITEIGAKNLLMLSAILETTPSTLLKTPVETFDYEFDNIHQFHRTGENKGMPNIDAPKYKFNENERTIAARCISRVEVGSDNRRLRNRRFGEGRSSYTQRVCRQLFQEVRSRESGHARKRCFGGRRRHRRKVEWGYPS